MQYFETYKAVRFTHFGKKYFSPFFSHLEKLFSIWAHDQHMRANYIWLRKIRNVCTERPKRAMKFALSYMRSCRTMLRSRIHILWCNVSVQIRNYDSVSLSRSLSLFPVSSIYTTNKIKLINRTHRDMRNQSLGISCGNLTKKSTQEFMNWKKYSNAYTHSSSID